MAWRHIITWEQWSSFWLGITNVHQSVRILFHSWINSSDKLLLCYRSHLTLGCGVGFVPWLHLIKYLFVRQQSEVKLEFPFCLVWMVFNWGDVVEKCAETETLFEIRGKCYRKSSYTRWGFQTKKLPNMGEMMSTTRSSTGHCLFLVWSPVKRSVKSFWKQHIIWKTVHPPMH